MGFVKRWFTPPTPAAVGIASQANAQALAQQQDTAAAAERQAAEARAAEEARQGRIREGMAGIDSTFGGFDDGFYNQRRQAYLDFALPQINEQSDRARRELLFALDRAGLTNSTAAGEKQRELELEIGNQRQTAASTADDMVTQARGDVANARTGAVNLLNQSNDAGQAISSARTGAASVAQPQSFSPLGTLFASAGQGIGNAVNSYRGQQTMNAYGIGAPDVAKATGKGSSRTVS